MAADKIRMELDRDSREILKRMKSVDMAKDLRKELVQATQGIVPAIRVSARNLPSSRKRVGAKAGSLRSAVAMAITRKIKVSTKRILIVVCQVPHGGKANLGRAVEGEIPWKHPVFGHDPEVTQTSHAFFYPPIHKFEALITIRVAKVFESYKKKF